MESYEKVVPMHIRIRGTQIATRKLLQPNRNAKSQNQIAKVESQPANRNGRIFVGHGFSRAVKYSRPMRL
jgi:hypothetical protein